MQFIQFLVWLTWFCIIFILFNIKFKEMIDSNNGNKITVSKDIISDIDAGI